MTSLTNNPRKQWQKETLKTYSFQDDVADVKTNRTERVVSE